MEKDVIIILEDEEAVRSGFRQLFEDNALDIELLECTSYEEYKRVIIDPLIKPRIKGFIMDLSNNYAERDSKSFEASEHIMTQYSNNRVPIFVHSAYLDYYSDLEDKGTVFKIKKDAHSTPYIIELIKLMKEAGFLDIFCFEGSLQNKIMIEIHKAFTEQFKGLEIESIIKSIKAVNVEGLKERTVEVFERLAIRAVYQNFVSNRREDEVDIKINAIEHYYRRKGLVFYTGDIFEHKESKQLVFLATPRCNITNNNYDELLLCKIREITHEQINNFINEKLDKSKVETVGLKSLRTSITDDVTNHFIGERFRFLPVAPQFCGGFVDFKQIITIKPEEFIHTFQYCVSLVDDLANDVIRKLASYLLRGGISDTHYAEAQQYLKGIVIQGKLEN